MRVLHVTRDFPPATKGGISKAVDGMVKALKSCGVSCGVVSFDGWRPRSGCKHRKTISPVTELPDGGIARVNAPPDIAAAHAYARSFGPDIIHVHHGMLWNFVEGVLREMRLPVLKTVHVIQKEMNRLRGLEQKTRSLKGQEAALYNSDHVIAPSNEAARILLDYYPFLKNRLTVIGFGINESETAGISVSNRAPGPSNKTIISVGRFDAVKGTAELIRLARLVLESRPDARIVVAGGIPANQRGEAKWLEAFRQGIPAGVRKRFEFTGWLSDDDLRGLYSEAAVYVSTSRFETFGLSVLEAMLHGLPVAAVRGGGIDELIEHGRTGLLSEPGDTEGLVQNVLSLFDHREAASRLGQAAATAVRKEMLWREIVPGLIRVYEGLLQFA